MLFSKKFIILTVASFVMILSVVPLKPYRAYVKTVTPTTKPVIFNTVASALVSKDGHLGFGEKTNDFALGIMTQLQADLPSISTNKFEYLPGEDIIVTGAGWQSGEIVSLLLQVEPAPQMNKQVEAIADAKGKFQVQISPLDKTKNIRVFLTATGKSSRKKAIARLVSRNKVVPLANREQATGDLVVKDLSESSKEELAKAILGSGVQISNVSYKGTTASAGTFSGGTGIIGFEGGIILSSGSIQNVRGPNKEDNITANNGLPGDNDASQLIPGFSTFDATVLEFDFVPTTNNILFQYVFSSDEYNEFANREYNDVFGFFLNGKNVALIPGTNTPVSINNVNSGNPLGTDAHHPQFYRNNDLSDGGGSINTEMDGLTQVLSVQAQVNAGKTNHIKLVIADAGDSILDSNVFIKASSFTTDITPELIALEVTQGIQDLNNTVPLIQDKRTFVRAHVKSPQGDLSQVSAKIIGTRIEADGTSRTPLGELMPSNIGKTVRVLQDPKRINLNDSFYFELPGAPQDWRRGTVELEFLGISHTFKGCIAGSNSCKATVVFEKATAPEMTMVGLAWKESHIFSPDIFHEPSLADLERAKHQIEALFPIPKLNASYVCPTFSAESYPHTSDQFIKLNMKLSQMRIADGCVSPPCKRYYLSVLTLPSGGVSGTIGMANDIPGDVATGYLDDLFTLAHEFGHDTGRYHTNYCGKHPGVCSAPTEVGPDTNYSPSDGTISGDKSDEGFFGFDIFGLLSNYIIYGPNTPDLMSYGHPSWISPYTYTGIKNDLATHYGSSFASLGATVNQSAGLAIMAGQPAVIVSGTVSFTQGTGDIGSIYAINSPASASAPGSGSYAIRFENSQGQSLVTYNFEPDKPSEGSGEVGSFVLLLPLSTNTARIALLQNSQVIASRTVSANAPTVTVTYPNGGELLTGSTSTFTWSASDPDNNPLSYVVQYSRDGGATWQTLISDLNATSYQVNLNMLAGTNQGLIRVLASDGFLTVQDQSNTTFTVAKHSPNPNIQSPANNRLYVGDQTIILEGGAYDIEDGQLGDAALTWRSSIDGVLGNGHTLSVNVSTLTPGNHDILLSAKDSDGQIASSGISIQIAKERPVFPAKISAAPFGLNFTVKASEVQITPQILAIRNSGDGTINWAANGDQNWIQLAFKNGITPANLPVTVNPQGLKVGQYTGHIMITSPEVPNGNQSVEVMLNVIEEASADLSISSAVSPNPVTSNSHLTYTITATNHGPDSAGNIVISDDLPAATTFVSCAATNGGVCGGTGNNRTVTFSSLAPGTSAAITLVAAINCAAVSGNTISNTVTVSSITLDPNPTNNSATSTVGVAPPQARLILGGGRASLDFGTTPAAREINPSPPSNTFVVENTGCLALTMNFALTRSGSDVSSGKITNLDDSAVFPLRIINPNGTETSIVPGSTSVQIPGGTQHTFRLLFNPLIPNPAGRTNNLFANQVISDLITSTLTLTPNNGSALVIPLTGRVATRARLINPLAPRLSPLIALVKSGDEYTVEFSAYDANNDIYYVTYQFLDANNSPVGQAPGFDLDLSQLVKGQSFTVVKKFTGASRTPQVNKVQVTIYDREGSETFISPPIGTVIGRVVSVSGASFAQNATATESIVSAFGTELANAAHGATSLPLPTELAGTRVYVRDSRNVERLAPLFYSSPQQINYQIPEGTAPGEATVVVTRNGEVISTETMQVTMIAPGIFTANSSGSGVAAAAVQRVRGDGSQVYEQVARYDEAQRKFVPIPIDLGPERDQVFLVLFGTGIRHRSSLGAVKARIGGSEVDVLYAGPQGGYVGLDQINLRVPRSLLGSGEVEVVLVVEGKTANPVRIHVR